MRGHAWAIYGFGTAYQFTGDKRFLDTARRCADLYIEKVGDAFVGPNDWEEASPEFPYEASGASIAAAAMLQLAELLGEDGDGYREYARGIVARLSTPEFLGTPDDPWEGIIKHSMYHRAEGMGVDESVMWGDYYFVEALDACRAALLKLVAIDVDGTLLTSAHEVTEATLDAVAAVRASGVEVVLASSRGARMMTGILDQLRLGEPAEFVAAQGALTASLTTDDGLRVIHEDAIPSERRPRTGVPRRGSGIRYQLVLWARLVRPAS